MYGGYDGQRGAPRGGIGSYNAPQNHAPANLPSPGSSMSSGMDSPAGEKFSLFASGIPPNVSDNRLHEIFEAAGSLIKVNRIRDAAGKPKGFGFVEYSDAESVLRCLEIINGIEIVTREGTSKPMVVKADAKVRERLDAHEAGREATNELANQIAFARDTLQDILASMRNDNDDASDPSSSSDPNKPYKIPSHLQDLEPGDLPEEQRGLVTREIAFFRERANKKEQESRAAEEKRNMARRQQADDQNRRAAHAHSQQNHQGQQQMRPFGGQRGPPEQPRGFQDQHQHQQNGERFDGRTPHNGRPSDPQSYNRPVGFVPSVGNGAPLQGQTDEEAERSRQLRLRQQAEREYHTRLQRWEQREKGKLQALEREKQAKFHEAQDNDRRRTQMLEKCAAFDDDEEMERGHETYIIDRPRWRTYRRAARRRELEQDAQDAQLEAQQAEALKKESEDFLNRQAELFASMSTSSNADASSGEPAKLTFLVPPKTAANSGSNAEKMAVDEAKPKVKAPAVFAEQEEEGSRRKRELIPLSYSDDEDTEEQKVEKKKRKVRDLVSAIPNDKEGLWSYSVRWEKLDETIIKDKLRPFVAKKSVEYLGSEEDDVIDTVIEHLRAHKGPAELTDEMEPLLAEEAEEFVIKVYRMLNFELLSALHGIQL